MKTELCPDCTSERLKSEMITFRSLYRCVYCFNAQKPGYHERTIVLLHNVMTAAIDVGVDEDEAEYAFDLAVQRIENRYGLKVKR